MVSNVTARRIVDSSSGVHCSRLVWPVGAGISSLVKYRWSCLTSLHWAGQSISPNVVESGWLSWNWLALKTELVIKTLLPGKCS